MVYSNSFSDGFGASNSGDVFDALGSEKERIEKGTQEFILELTKEWQQEHAGGQIFPEKIAAMHPEVVDFLLNFKLVSIYDDIAKQASLDQTQRNKLPQVVWNIAQTKNWTGVAEAIQNEIVQGPQCQTVAQLVEKNITSMAKTLSEKPIVVKREVLDSSSEVKMVMMTFEEALQRYHKLGEQIVSSNMLKLRIFPTPVRPSIKNWITDYHDYVGSGKHTAVDRGNYLFQSANGKKLTTVERQKVSDLLKIADQNEKVLVDREKETLIFPEQQKERQNTPTVPPTNGEVFKKNITSFFSGNANTDNTYVSKVQHSAMPSAPVGSDQAQEDVFDRYSQEKKEVAPPAPKKQAFSPNFADKQSFVINKKSDVQERFYSPAQPPREEIEQFRKSTAGAPVGNEDVQFGQSSFYDFQGPEKNEDGIDGEISFSTPQKFSAERKDEIQASKIPPTLPPTPQATPQAMPEQKPPVVQPPRQAPTYRPSWQHIEPSSRTGEDNDDIVHFKNQQ